MELRSLRYFLAVAEERHFGRAAEMVHISQPGLSQQIKALEGLVGVPLFVRSRGSVALTEVGSALLPMIEKLVADADELTRRAQELVGDHGNGLQLAYTRSADVSLCSALTAHFRCRFPSVQVLTRSGFTSANITDVECGDIDVAFVRTPIAAIPKLRTMVIQQERIVIALPAGHRLASTTTIQKSDLRNEPLVFFPKESAPGMWRSTITGIFGADTPNIVRLEPDEPHILAAVAAGIGVSLVTESAMRILDVPGVVCIELADPPLVGLGLTWRRDNTNAALRAFLEITRRTTSRGSAKSAEHE